MFQKYANMLDMTSEDLDMKVRALVRSRRLDLPEAQARRRLRTESELTQADLASLIGVKPGTISRWESGARRPRGRLLSRYLSVITVLKELSDG